MKHTKKTKALERVHNIFAEHMDHTITWRVGKEEKSGQLKRVKTNESLHAVELWVEVPGEKFLTKLYSDQLFVGCSCGKA